MSVRVNQVVWVEEYFKPQPFREAGRWVDCPAYRKSRRLAIITSGSYMGEYNRVSNSWSWVYLDADGVQTKERGSGCNNGVPFLLIPADEFKVQLRAIPAKGEQRVNT